jgi:transcriptional regulator with XRE-family HTH domain
VLPHNLRLSGTESTPLRPNRSKRPTLGSLLRGLRVRNGWTLKQMSERTGIPLSTLAKVEHDRLTLTYDKLLQLSQRLNVRMSDLFSENAGTSESAITARRSIGRLSDAIRVNTPNYEYFYMCPDLRRKRMVPTVTRVRSHSIEEFGDLVHHPGEEYIYVLQGPVEIHTEFYEPILLQTGESIYLDSTMGHAYVTPKGQDEALVLGVCSSADDDLMDSLMALHDDDGPSRPKALKRVTGKR